MTEPTAIEIRDTLKRIATALEALAECTRRDTVAPTSRGIITRTSPDLPGVNGGTPWREN